MFDSCSQCSQNPMQMISSKSSWTKVHFLPKMFSSWDLDCPRTELLVFLSFHLCFGGPEDGGMFLMVSAQPPRPRVVGITHGQGWEETLGPWTVWCLAHSRHLTNARYTELKFGDSARDSEKSSSWGTPGLSPSQWLRKAFSCVLPSLLWLVRTCALWPFFSLRCKGLTRVLLLVCIRNRVQVLISKDEISNGFSESFKRPPPPNVVSVTIFQAVASGQE